VRPREKQIITRLLKKANYTVTKMKGGKDSENDIIINLSKAINCG
jgi:hypothetical protein